MATEPANMIRVNHEGWKIAVRNARLIEDGQGSVISKSLIPKKDKERISQRKSLESEVEVDEFASMEDKCDKNSEQVKLPPLVPKTDGDSKPARRFFHRNNPHPHITFPFQSGDWRKTYMVWSADTGMEPPPFLREKFPPRPKLKQSTNALNEGYKTVYQLEISEMPARMRYGVDAVNYQPPELMKHSPYATKYSWATDGFMRDTFPSFRHHDVPPVPSRHDTEVAK